MSTQVFTGTNEHDGRLVHDSERAKADLLAEIAQNKRLLELPDDKLADWMVTNYKQQLDARRYLSLPGRFKRMVQKGIATGSKGVAPRPDVTRIAEFRAGVKRALEKLEDQIKK